MKLFGKKVIYLEKLNVCVIFGGVSSEHEISKISAATVIDSLDTAKYNIHKIFIDTEGNWIYFDKPTSEYPLCRPENMTRPSFLHRAAIKGF